jgi:hypothetical protein
MFFASKKPLYNKKGHQPVSYSPLMASEPNRAASSGAGYDDQNDNNAVYGFGAGKPGTKCGPFKHY